jgi:hypothetical protein
LSGSAASAALRTVGEPGNAEATQDHGLEGSGAGIGAPPKTQPDFRNNWTEVENQE